MIITVLIHETGHLIFGLLTGYRPISFKILWIVVEDKDPGIRLRIKAIRPIGQCLMYPKKADAFPDKMILGGSLFNLIFGMMFLIIGMTVSGMVLKIIMLYLTSLGIAIGIYNLFFGSAYSDGKTLLEIKRNKEAGVAYNNLLMIYRYLYIGRSYADMPESLFAVEQEYAGTIFTELKEHREMKEKYNGCNGKTV